MRFNRNVSFNDMKEKISAKIVRRCGRRILKLFYKFPILTDPIKFTEMELVDDEDVETMIALYCGNRSDQNAPTHLFTELAGVEPNEDLTAYGEEHGAQELCMVAPISYVDSESTIRGIDTDLNVAHDIDLVNSDSDPDVNEIPNDIDDEYVNDDENINASLVVNQIRHIVIHNNLEPHMSLIDLDATHIVEFSEYPEILPAHWLAVNFDPKELFVGQRFESKEERVFVIKRYSMNISMDYKATVAADPNPTNSKYDISCSFKEYPKSFTQLFNARYGP
ncbi:hypothetical protein GOBAR_DD25045 [Gossypium barbadense]|nr:hypothetical protein GOBAR_DD25045 [Gossypium barbadense]